MKKLLVLIGLLIIITGCSANVTYEFNEESIDSTIEFIFNQEEFKKYGNENTVHEEGRFDTEADTEKFIKDKYEETTLIAYQENGKFKYYTPTKYEKLDNQYRYLYKHSFNYDNFQNNYYLKDCFEHFLTIEDDNYYHYTIKGDYSCGNENDLKLNIIAKNKDVLSNADEVKDDKHIWNIKKENNDITFSLSKSEKAKSSALSTIHIIGLVLLAILGIIGVVLYKLINKDK